MDSLRASAHPGSGCRTAWPVHRRAHTMSFKRGGEASQVPGRLLRTCPAHRPRQDLTARPHSRSMSSSAQQKASTPTKTTFEAQSRGLCASCVHFTSPVARRRTTLGSGWRSTLAGRDSHPRSRNRDFRFYILPSLPSFAWRTCCMARLAAGSIPLQPGVRRRRPRIRVFPARASG